LIESFNGWLRDKWLNQYWLLSITNAQRTIRRWQRAGGGYDTAQLSCALKHLTPA